MPYPADHAVEVRRRIVRSARRLFNRSGFAGVSIDAIMADAGLTRGAFYHHFPSKGDLYAEAVSHILVEHPALTWDGVPFDPEAPDFARQIVNAYLSQQHMDDIDASCPLVALPGEIAREDDVVRQAFESVLGMMIAIFERQANGGDGSRRERALAMASLCVGGMVLARGVSDPALAGDLRAAARQAALGIGGLDLISAPASAAGAGGSSRPFRGPDRAPMSPCGFEPARTAPGGR